MQDHKNMPSKNQRLSKNARRLRAADGALHNMTLSRNASNRQSLALRTRPRRKPRPRQTFRRIPALTMGPQSLGSSQQSLKTAVDYIGGLCTHRVRTSQEVAVPCAFPEPYREYYVRWRISPKVYNGAAVVVFNPELMWCNQFNFYGDNAGTISTIPTCGYATAAGTFFPGFAGTMNGGLDTTAITTQYGGKSRFLGAELTFQSLTTELNMGGKLTFTHAPYSTSLLAANIADTATQISSTDFSTIAQATDMSAVFAVTSGKFEAVLEPHTTEFCDVESDTTNYVGAAGTVADLYQSNAQLVKYCPTSKAAPTHLSWNRCIIYEPAESIADGNLAKCYIDVVCHYHLNVQQCGTSQSASASAGTALTRPGLPQPVEAGIVNNALTTIRQTRTVSPQSALKTPKDPPHHGPVREVVEQLSQVAKPVATAVDAVVGAIGKFF